MQLLDSGALRLRFLFGVATVLLIVGCGNPDAGTFHEARPEGGAAAQAPVGPGSLSKAKAPANPSAATPKKGRIQPSSGGGAPKPD